MAVQTYEATVVFDKPKKLDSKFNPGEKYYAMCLELPPGAPGTEHVKGENYERDQAYITFNEGSDEEAYLLSLNSGDRLMVAWQTSGKRQKYVPVIPDNAVKQAPAQAQTESNATPAKAKPYKKRPAPPPQSYPDYDEDGTYSGESLVAYDAAVEEAVFMLEMAHARVADNEKLGQLPAEVQQKYAVTAFLSAKNRFRDIDARVYTRMKSVKERVSQNQDIGAAREAIYAIDPASLPGSLLSTIAETLNLDGIQEVAGILKRFGLSRDDIDPNDRNTWWRMYMIVSFFALREVEVGEAEAAQNTAHYFDLDLKE